MQLSRIVLGFLLVGLCAVVVFADGPADNQYDNVRPVPPKGVVIPPTTKAELEAKLVPLETAIAEFRKIASAESAELLPDVEIYAKAVRVALQYQEFFNAKEFPIAMKLLEQGTKRMNELKANAPSWTKATGLVVRGYRSKLDDSVQPYGLVVPESFTAEPGFPRRLDFWWHGRGENLSELNFIDGRQKSGGEFIAANTFVLHPYGRYCNANKLAGEVDTFECYEHVKKHYAIDPKRIVARGFSMGGAACWQFATHYPTFWCAAAPGAGFAETPEFLNVFQNEKVNPTWYEKKLWSQYNATDYAENLFNLPTVAYSGEVDKQKQAADVMAREMTKVGLTLNHIIGPKTGHSYEKSAKPKINAFIDAAAAKGLRPQPEYRFVTYTLRYNQCGPIEVLGLEKHWEKSRITLKTAREVHEITTSGIREFSIPLSKDAVVTIDGKPVGDFSTLQGISTTVAFRKSAEGWKVSDGATPRLVKRPGLQGPIDDAFLSRFVFVVPTGAAQHPALGAWVKAEAEFAKSQWRSQFRGDVIIKTDAEVTDDDFQNANLILWGDPSSNSVLGKLLPKLPLNWNATTLTVNGVSHDATTHLPVMVYPNPMNPAKYVVLNSGFTFRPYDNLNNARQVPKLPDYAVLDTRTKPNARYAGKVVQAGFFGEQWEWLTNDGEK